MSYRLRDRAPQSVNGVIQCESVQRLNRMIMSQSYCVVLSRWFPIGNSSQVGEKKKNPAWFFVLAVVTVTVSARNDTNFMRGLCFDFRFGGQFLFLTRKRTPMLNLQ